MATQERGGIKDKIYSRLKRSQEDYKNPEYQPTQAPQHSGYNGDVYNNGGAYNNGGYDDKQSPYIQQQQGYQQAGGPPYMPQQGYQPAGGPPPQYDSGYGCPPMQQQQGFQQAGGPSYNNQYQEAGGPSPMQQQQGYQQAGGPPYMPQQQQGFQSAEVPQQSQTHQKHHRFRRNNNDAAGDNLQIEDNGNKEWKEENDLVCLLKSLERSVHGQELLSPESLIEGWIQEKESKLKRWRNGMKSGAGVQTFGLGLVTFGLGPIPINMSLMAGLNKHIVHTFSLDDQRVDHFVKSTLAYGGKQLGKKLATIIAKTVLEVGTSSAVGIVPLIGPVISATMTAHKISKTAKQTTKDCAQLVRDICQEALANNRFDI